jgi:hypothetical protein
MQEMSSLLDELLMFAQNPGLSLDVDSAFNLFWNGDYGPEAAAAIESLHLVRFFEWFIFGYPTLADRKPLIQVYLAEQGESLSRAKRELLEQWMTTRLGAYHVEDVVRGRSMLLRDLFADGEERVRDEYLSSEAARGDIVIGRIIKAPTGWRLSAAPILVPSSWEEGLVAFMAARLAAQRERAPDATMDDLLRESGYTLNHFLTDRAQGGATTGRAPRHYDIGKVIEALEKSKEEFDRQRAEEEARHAEEMLSQADQQPGFKTTAGGLLLPSDPPPPDPDDEEKTFAGGKLLLP